MAEWTRNKINTSDAWIYGCTEWMNSWIVRDWTAYYMNFMFEPLGGPPAAIVSEMRRGIHKFYGRFCTKFIHNGRAESEQRRMPMLWLFPDLPVFKRNKTALREVTINGGLHYNGPLLIPPVSSFNECPIKHFGENQSRYCKHGIERIHIVKGGEVTGLVDYAAKTIKNRRADADDIIILPRPVKELPAKNQPILDPSNRLLKDIQSQFNVSDEIAKNMLDGVINAGRLRK